MPTDLVENRLKSLFLEGMKKYNIKSLIVTSIQMERENLLTKKQMVKICKEKDPESRGRNGLVNDDLESFFEDCRLGLEQGYDWTLGYFLPKLTEEEMELVETKDRSYLETFMLSNPDVLEDEMMLSEADSKFVRGTYLRKTFIIENSSSVIIKWIIGSNRMVTLIVISVIMLIIFIIGVILRSFKVI